MEKIQVMDTTLRDGEQTSGVAFTIDEKLTIARSLLLDVKVDAIEVGSALVSDSEQVAATQICSWAKENKILDRIEILGFVNKTSVDWIEKTGCKVMNLLCKGSLEHVKKQLKKTPQEHIKDIKEIIGYAGSKGISSNLYLEDVSNGMLNSKDYVFQLLDNIEGVKRVMLPDTLGIWNPEQTKEFCKELTEKYPKKKFDFHAHNDYGLAVANTLAAIRSGITRIHTTVNSLGERTGNCSLSTAIAAIHDHTDKKTNVDEKKLSSVSKLLETMTGIRLSPNYPIVGENVFTQACGVHADGDKKGNLYCNKISPERFGGKREYALGKTSGKASIQKNLEELGIELDEDALYKVLKRVVEIGEKKEMITVSDLPYIVSDVLGESMKQDVKLTSYSLSVDSEKGPHADIKLQIKGQTYSESATGDGQYDALMKAVKKIYAKLGKKLPKLVDYGVRIPPGGKTDALVETVITWQSKMTFKTRGVDSDQTAAAIKATLNMLNRNGF